MNILNIFMGVLLMILAVLVLSHGETIVVGEQICVDGDGYKNLEGIMCEDTNEIIFGLGPFMSSVLAFISILTFIFGMFITIISILELGDFL